MICIYKQGPKNQGYQMLKIKGDSSRSGPEKKIRVFRKNIVKIAANCEDEYIPSDRMLETRRLDSAYFSHDAQILSAIITHNLVPRCGNDHKLSSFDLQVLVYLLEGKP